MMLARSSQRLWRQSVSLSRYASTSVPPASTSTPLTPEDTTDVKSTTQSAKKHNKQAPEIALLYDAVLSKVPEHGWSDLSVSEAVRELGWSPAARGMLPRGPVQVAEEFVLRCNRDMATKLAAMKEMEEAEGAGDSNDGDMLRRAGSAIEARIRMIEPYHASWAQALALQALPQNASSALRSSALMVDEIAHYTGYRSPDFSWYTDRAVLGLTYHAAELFWLTDDSNDRFETWRFLEKSLRDAHNVRSGAGASFERFMNASDAGIATVSTLLRSARRSY